MTMTPLVLLSDEEFALRISHIREAMNEASVKQLLITDNANLFYLTGRVYAGYAYIPAEGLPLFFIRRPSGLKGDGVVYIRKPEEMGQTLALTIDGPLGLELDLLPYSAVTRLDKAFGEIPFVNVSPLLRQVRAVKTPAQIEEVRKSGIHHSFVYSRIPHIYREGMTDNELQIEIERVARLEGCLGQFRISGDTMEIYMGSLLVGKNAENPTPYDFAMGGAGMNPSLPVGSDGTLIAPGNSVMVDMNGNFTGYMTDMTRTFRVGEVSPLAVKAHQCSIDICCAVAKAGVPGTPAKQLYELAEKMVADAGLHEYFMGLHQKAGFIGHGVGIEINELPVIAPRSRDILQEGNVIALEPKFVIPKTGAVGIENTYVVRADGMECLTKAPEEMIELIK